MHGTRTKTIIAVAAVAVLVGAVATGRQLLEGAPGASLSAPRAPLSSAAPSARTADPEGATKVYSGKASVPAGSAKALTPASSTHGPSGTAGTATGAASALPDVPVAAVTPLVVHTATIHVRVGKGRLESTLRTLTTLAGADGGYVDSSSVSGGTARRSPVAGTVVFRVLDSEFAGAVAAVGGLGTVDDQQIKGRDVTVEAAQNAASVVVLEDEVALLEKKLAEAPDIGSFLQIQGQLFPVEQQLQQLQSAQAVLENSAALATVTVDLTAPGTAVVRPPAPRSTASAVSVAWRYLRHNTLAVLDGLAVAVGWALPALVLLALVGSIALRVVRRRRHAVTPA